ncbi:MAG: NnrS family protein [Xanthobacteraceae bacterium]|nr:NnrS family protein [Xanthobacteraceae bacterium]
MANGVTAGIPRLRAFTGPALLSYGFRPFFLFGAVYAGGAILIWLPLFSGQIELPSVFTPRDWHVHEMLFGFVPAIVTGFLLTAIPNWTGRLPLQGLPLLTLVVAWIAGRVAVTFSALIGWTAAAAIDVAFLALVAAAASREIVAGSNWRDLKVVTVVAILVAANLVFHLEVHFHGSADYAVRLGIGAVILLISLVGGRVVPSFTHNWLASRSKGRMPRPFGRFDMLTVAASAAALIAWVAAPFASLTGAALLAAGLLQSVRLLRWAGERTLANPLVLVLHVGYAFVPLGFILAAAAALGMVPLSAAIHAWTGGAVGVMTLAVMTRASLGHTGRALAASVGTQAIYALVVVAALARIGSSLHPDWFMPLLWVAGAAWAAAFLGFAALYGAPLCRPRI